MLRIKQIDDRAHLILLGARVVGRVILALAVSAHIEYSDEPVAIALVSPIRKV